jgi:hypothetical protein
MLRSGADRVLSGLEKRHFLLHDVHRPGGPVVFESRWARAFLRGPLAPREIPELARGFAEAAPASGGSAAAATSSAPSSGSAPEPGAPVPPALDPVFESRFAPGAPSGARLSGEPAVLLEARVSRQRPPVSGTLRRLVRFGTGAAPQAAADETTRLDEWTAAPPAGATYGTLPLWLTRKGAAASLDRAARELLAADGFSSESVGDLGVVRAPGEDEAAFAGRIAAAVDAEATRRLSKVRAPRERRIAALERQIAAESRELDQDRAEEKRAATYSAIDVGAGILGTILGGGKRSAGSTVRAGGRAYGRIQRAAEDVKESEEKIAAWTRERDELKSEIEQETAAERARLEQGAARRETTRIPIGKADVRALGWYVMWVSKT